jgi:DNA polymerase-1
MSNHTITKTKTVVLVDGHALAYRMYFALERTQMRNSDDIPTWAVYGFFNAIFQLLNQRQPDALVFAFDVARESFRTEWYPDYKANRSSMPEDMRQQMDVLYEGIDALGLPVFRIAGVEADDVIGTLSKKIIDTYPDWHVDVLTGDQDSFQMIDRDNRINILIPARNTHDGLTVYDWDGVINKWGVTPEQVADFKGLKGDASDNIPGVKGIGDKTAAKLLDAYQSLENIYAHLDEITPAGVKRKLEDGKEMAFLSKKLAIIVRDLEVVPDLEHAHLGSSQATAEALGAYFDTYNFRTFQRNLPKWTKLLSLKTDGSLVEEAVEEVPTTQTTQAEALPFIKFPPFTYEVVQDLERLQAIFKEIKDDYGICAFDVETTGLNVHDVELVGFGLSWGKGLAKSSFSAKNVLHLKDAPTSYDAVTPNGEIHLQNVYVPLAHVADLLSDADAQRQIPYSEAFPLLKAFLEDSAVLKLIHNLKYERNCTRHWGIELAGPVLDTMIMSYVLAPENKHGLKGLGERELDFAMTPIDELIGKKGKKQITFADVPIDKAAPYGASDTYATWCLAVLFSQRLAAQPDLASLFYEIENPLTWVLAELEYNGIRLEKAPLQALAHELDAQVETLDKQAQIYSETPINLNSPKQVGELLFDQLGIQPKRKTATKSYSTDSKVLESLIGEHPIIQVLLDYRQLFKLKSTYVDTLPQLVKPQTGRLHTSFNQIITATGRLSSSDPNLQNIPVRSTWGQRIREAFVAEEGWQLISADYSQIELRILAHLCQDKNMIDAFQSGVDIHTATASLVFGVPIEAVTKEQRYAAKSVNFGIVYGQTAHGLSQQIGVPYAEAQDFINRYFRTYPDVKRWIADTIETAHETGFGTTMFGRKRDLSRDLNSGNKSIREFAERASFNTPVQGAAAELLKIAMLRLNKRLKADGLQSRVLLQVHDELVLEAPPNEVEATQTAIRWAMECEQPLRVPLVVDLAVGHHWGELG